MERLPVGEHNMAVRVVRPRRRLRAGLTQLICSGAGLLLGLLVPRVDGGLRVDATRTVEVLVTVALAVVGVASLIFSLLFLVVQWAAGSFTPRLALFRTDPTVWRTFGFVMGLLVYSTSATLAIGAKPDTSVLVPVLALVLTLVALGLVRNLQVRAFESIQLAHVLAITTQRAHEIVDAFYPDGGIGRSKGESDQPRLPPLLSTVKWPGTTTIVEQLDILNLMTAATRAGSVVVMRVAVGATIQHGTTLAEIRGGDLVDGEVVQAVIAGRERTFRQDPTFAFRLLSDIGLRALSPAVNDPATAVQVLDAMEGLLGRLVRTAPGAFTDSDDNVLVILKLPVWKDFVRVGLDDLLAAGTTSPMVLLRARALLLALLAAPAPPHRLAPLSSRLAWIEKELSDRYPLIWQEAADEAAEG
ncbi:MULTISPECIES: DUF2254 family protein [Streptomyces]|uniref:DUF2254 family protein n=2 Tax=Streptomyces TaxID=1883 RepID=UPI001E53D22F|nr:MULTISPECIES: DUF2254 family protein [Streptomyces]MCZ4099881.1 DUF2254 domain-containing protein [Streptomyces sp. H39-C1]